MSSLRIVFAGSPEFAVPALRALFASPHHVVGVLSQPDRPRGRGQRMVPGPVTRTAQLRGVPIAQPATLRSEDARAILHAWSPDALIVVAYGLLLPPAVLELPRLGCINIHPSLLPRWRGAAPIQRAILAGDAETGVTIMQMDAGLDTGPVILQRRLYVQSNTAATLQERLAALGAEVLLEALSALAAGRAESQAQPTTGVTYAAKIDKSEAHIDWHRSAIDIERQVRAFNPWPVAETRLGSEPVRILAARAVECPEPATPGAILGIREDAIVVGCGAGCLAVSELQRPGRKVVSARDFANATRLAGRCFEPRADPEPAS